MNTTLKVKSSGFSFQEEVEIKIVLGYNGQVHTHEYSVFELKHPIPQVGLIGVENEDVFSIMLSANFKRRVAFSVYLDGVNVQQKNGIKSLNSVPENQMNDSRNHPQFIVDFSNGGVTYLNRYSQLNSENRTFTFSTKKNFGVNEVLIGDPSLSNRLEVLVWKDQDPEYIDFMPETGPIKSEEIKTRIGAGKATNKEFGTAKPLEFPVYMGKVLFVHLHNSALTHLGPCVVPKANSQNFRFDDPMNLVPSS